MLHTVAKLLLVTTSLAPVLLVAAVVELEKRCAYELAASLAASALALALLCYLVLSTAKRNQKYRLSISKVERRDHEVIAYLFVYLLPFMRGSSLVLEMPLTIALGFTIIVTALYMANAFHFNPTMWVFGYRFYAVQDECGQSLTLVGSKKHPRPRAAVRAHQLTNEMYVLTEDTDV